MQPTLWHQLPAQVLFQDESARLAFLIAELNSVDVMSCDLENACLDVPCQEKIWFEGSPECGEDHGKILILAGALHGLKIMGASWRATLAEVLEDLAFKSVRADPDMWIRLAVQDDGFEHCEMIFVCIDDILAVSHTAKSIVDEITSHCKVKKDSIEKPELHLGANIDRFQLPDSGEVWSLSPGDCVKNAIETAEKPFVKDGEGCTLKNNVKNPFPQNHKPESDVTDESGPELASRFLQLIGVC